MAIQWGKEEQRIVVSLQYSNGGGTSPCRRLRAEMLRGSGFGQWQEGQRHFDLHCSAEEHGEEARAMESDGVSSANYSEMASEIILTVLLLQQLFRVSRGQ